MVIGKATMPFGCSVALRSLSHSLLLLQPSFGQLLVSFMPLHSLRPSLRYITPRSYLNNLLQGMAHLPHTNQNTVMHIPFRKPPLQYSLGSIPLHYVLHSFQSHSVHPLPIILLALLACCGYGFVMVFDLQHKALINHKHTPNPCV